MKEKAIRKMNREELLELLIQYSDEKEALEMRVAELEKQLAESQKKLEDRTIVIARAGSLAEASMQLNGVFEAAQRAADQYLENIRRMSAVYKEESTEAMAQAAGAQTATRRRKRGMGI